MHSLPYVFSLRKHGARICKYICRANQLTNAPKRNHSLTGPLTNASRKTLACTKQIHKQAQPAAASAQHTRPKRECGGRQLTMLCCYAVCLSVLLLASYVRSCDIYIHNNHSWMCVLLFALICRSMCATQISACMSSVCVFCMREAGENKTAIHKQCAPKRACFALYLLC